MTTTRNLQQKETKILAVELQKKKHLGCLEVLGSCKEQMTRKYFDFIELEGMPLEHLKKVHRTLFVLRGAIQTVD